MKTLDVIFRATRHGDHAGEVTAVFPSQPGTPDLSTCTVYAHIGQHGSGTRAWYRFGTRAATFAEYEALLRELRGIYERGADAVQLRVTSRWTHAHDQERARNLEVYKK